MVQQGVWDTPLESVPLASGFLKATIDADTDLAPETEVRIFNFRGGETVSQMAQVLFGEWVADVIGFSVAGWNLQQFGVLAETFRQLNRDGWVVMGGNHVANQGKRVFRLFSDVDVVVNGEGEEVIRELIAGRLAGKLTHELGGVRGISFRDADGRTVSTEDAPRIQDLDSIPSPFLNGAIPMKDASGRFPYDVALMETSRGCPYKCAFCYWGGAVGQKMRAFSRERLREELELFAHHEVDTVVLCDSNFGMRPADEEFLEDFIETRERHGYPNSLETSWAKNKSQVFRRIVKRMTSAGLKSSFTLALQTLSDDALEQMRRRNMRLNDWKELVEWLRGEGLDCYVELIWGAPGETAESFMRSYDHLAEHVPRIATYPLLLLPNTHYVESREDFGFVTVRGRSDDFEYVLAHNGMSMGENREMQRFLLWARVVAENMVFRHLLPALRRFAGLRQSKVLLGLADWFDLHSDLASLRAGSINLGDPDVVPNALRDLHSGGTDALFERWWAEVVLPTVDEDSREFLTDVFRYDMLTRPVFDVPGRELENLRLLSREGEDCYIGSPQRFRYSPYAIVREAAPGATNGNGPAIPPAAQCDVTFRYRTGFHQYLENHEMAAHFLGTPDRVNYPVGPEVSMMAGEAG